MSQEIMLLVITAASLGFIHTTLGPDHYIPFIAMSKARHWSVLKTSLITISCGIGHVLGSVIIGAIGIGFGLAIRELQGIESARGEIATWLLISFGLVYLTWGLRKAFKNKPHSHVHIHENGDKHFHLHTHEKDHLHVHLEDKEANITPWILFTIFIFGPCEVLIPLFIYAATIESTLGVILVTSIFGITTILTMLTIVLISLYGIHLISFDKLERYAHALAGGMILLCGVGVKFFGL
jgi:sulfite exporter TauE/SafE